jgi:DNA-binding response OmpR family regulator
MSKLEGEAASKENKARPPRVIVAEDDPAMLELIGLTLRERGYDVVELGDGGRLLVRLAAQMRSQRGLDADLIVSDIRMPVMSGLAMLKALRDARFAGPVLLMTAFSDAETRGRAARLGARVLDKPFTMEALCAAVEQALVERTAAAS